MNNRFRFYFLMLTVMLVVLVPVVASAQEITGSFRVTVLQPSGEPAVGEAVTVTDTRTGSARTSMTNDNGVINIRGLAIGGPFTIRVDSETYRSTMVTDAFTKLTGATTYNLTLEDQGALEEVIVVASSMVLGSDVAIGPSSSFNIEQIEAMPSISREIRDVIRLDPRVNITRAGAGGSQSYGINCLGGSARSNSFTIDGVRSADGFGLNASGTSARHNFPIPFDVVRAASVEFAPIDVQYGHFTGCNVNVVTKSGGNEFNVSAFYLYSDDSMSGDSIDGDIVSSGEAEDIDWGFEFGGPIIKDKLFFYVAYEETDDSSVQNSGPIGGGFANEGFITMEEAAQIKAILASKYDRDVGEIVRSLPGVSERIFARIDWNINDNHRFEATYRDLEESSLGPDDYGFGGFTFSDNFNVNGTEQDSYSLRLFSNWTDRFSTEIRFSSLDVLDQQDPLGGGEAQDDNKPRLQLFDGRDEIMTSGPGQFRSANALNYTLEQFKAAADYIIGDHTLTFGFEQDALDVFNLFISNATGTIDFASIEDLEAGMASFMDGFGSYTGDPTDAGATFARDVNTVYLQDFWTLSDRLAITAGLRYDWYESSDVPIENSIWEQRYGFKNTQTFEGLDILLPRIGLTYDLPWDRIGDLQLRAGFGVFTGGDPTVHFANSYQNFGGAIGFGRSSSSPCTDADLEVLSSGSFNGLPACITAQQIAQATQNTGRAAAVDPDFELASQQRWNLGATLYTDSGIEFFKDWEVQFDYIYSNHKDSPDWLDLTLTQRVDENGNLIFLPDGRPQFFAVDPLLDGCDATLNGFRGGFSNVTTACDAGSDDQDILMTNGPSGSTTSISVQLAKQFFFRKNSSLDLRMGYAYTDAEVGNPVTNSTDTSSFEEVAVAVINQTKMGPAYWANKHNFVLGTTFKWFFFDNHPTTIGLFYRKRSGRPFSYTYDNNTPTIVFGDSDNEERNLFYVPTGVDDPRVDMSQLESAGTLDDFMDFLESTGLSKYAGQVSPKNGFTGPSNTDLDLRFSQAFPLPGFNHSLIFFADFENILNMFSDSNNIQKFMDSGDVNEGVPILDAELSDDGSQFIYKGFAPGGSKQSDFIPIIYDVDDTVWRIQIGLRYNFN